MAVLRGTTFLAAGVVVALAISAATPRAAVGEATRQSARAATSSAPGVALRHFSADLAIRHWRVSASGTVQRSIGPAAVMRVVREQRSRGWVTTLSVERGPGAIIDGPEGRTALSNPFRVARVEFGDDDAEPRLFDVNGRPVRTIGPDDLRLVGAVAATRVAGRRPLSDSPAGAGFLAEAGHEAARRLDLVHRFGQPVGRVGDLERYVSTGADGRHEALVMADAALPVDLVSSSTTGGRLRTTLAYELRPGYGHVRRLIRSEHHLPQADAGYAVTQVELSKVTLSAEARP